MKLSEIEAPHVHDLLQIDTHALTADSVPRPAWVRETLIYCPWVVVRRGQVPVGQIAVGVRGATRGERWAGFCGQRLIKKVVRPQELLMSHASNSIPRTPALRVLREMSERWAELALPWGPVGSVGFELATGRMVTTEASDLDVVIRASQRITIDYARWLFNRTIGSEAKVDVRVETPVCGFSLEEYVIAGSSQILLRYRDGVRLGRNAWPTLGEVTSMQRAAS
jgi:phosphoribosyl-dephospho-CoA transferase